MNDLTLKTSTQKSVIHCGDGTFSHYAPLLKDKKLFVITDSNVFAYYRYAIWKTLGELVPIYIIPAGESSKSLRYLTFIIREMLKYEMGRDCTVVAVGGGVVGDIAGLAASVYMRGVRLVQIPTTLLSQVDSSVGGKTAVDFDGVKNLIGTFYQPEEVICDPSFLATLPEREIRCGLGEIIKYGALNAEIYRLINQNLGDLAEATFLSEVTELCIRHKAEVVEKDEHDLNGLRKTLNLGHTTGHAFELRYGKKSHGEFVLIGMYYELFMALKQGVCEKSYAASLTRQILAVLKKVPAYDDAVEAVGLAGLDKKNSGGLISVVVPVSEGKCTELRLPPKEYAEMLAECAKSLKEKK